MYLTSKQRRAEAAQQRLNERIKSSINEHEKERKKLELISSLRSVLSELSNEHDKIQSSIDSCIKEHTQRLEEKMKEFMIKFEQDPSTEPPPFQIEESFKVLLSNSKLKFQEISKQIEFINGLIQNVSSDLPDSSISKHEQIFIDILSAYSFFRSKDVASVPTMIEFCLNMRVCLEHLITYLTKFRSAMRNEIIRHGKKPTDFTIDPKELKDQQLEEFLQNLSKLRNEIEERKIPFFSTTSLVEFIFSINPADFLSISEDTRRLEDRIKEINQIFYIKKKSFVEFVEGWINHCDRLVCKSHSSDSGGRSDDDNPRYEDPVEEHGGNLKRSLEQIRSTRV